VEYAVISSGMLCATRRYRYIWDGELRKQRRYVMISYIPPVREGC